MSDNQRNHRPLAAITAERRDNEQAPILTN
jgi:hypothetical protein